MTIISTDGQRARYKDKVTIPKVMRAAAIDHYGGPEALTLHHLPTPSIGAGEVLIQIHTAGVGVWDADFREGMIHSAHANFPLIPGTDGSGRVVAVGSRVRRFRMGQQVYSYSFDNPKGGFHAEYVAVDAKRVAPLPEGLDLRKAGAIATTGLTAIQGIDDALGLKTDERVIIHGGSGGVGTLAIQFARLRGARVLAIASGSDGVTLVRRLGAHVAVDGHNDDVGAAARSFAPDGVDAVLGLAGGDALERCVEVLRPGGRLAYPNGVEPEPGKRGDIAITPYDAVAGVREFQRLNMAVEAIHLRVPIAATFPLPQAAKSHQRLALDHVLGKIVLRIA
jgi:NADPH2:quinone reductase